MRGILGKDSFLDRVRRTTLPGQQRRANQVIATARALLACASLVAIYIDPTEPTRYAAVAYGLLAAYVGFSLGVLAWIRWGRDLAPRDQFIIHATDVLWAGSITLLTEGPNSPFYLFFQFVLLSAAYRWGMRETVATAGTVSAILITQAAVLKIRPWGFSFLPEGEFEINRFLMRATYLLIMGFLLGYLAEQEKLLRAETALVAQLVGRIRVERGLRSNLQVVLGEVLHLSGARRALLVVEESASGGIFLWEAHAAEEGEAPSLQLRELEPGDRAVYLFESPAGAWCGGPAPDPGTALSRDGRRIRPQDSPPPARFPGEFRSLAWFSLSLGESWTGRLFLPDPRAGSSPEKFLSVVQTLLRESAPAIYNVYLLRRLRSRAGAVERARMARELHDGAIQSLLAVEMKVDVLRRRVAVDSPQASADLERIQHLIHNETLNLRELMYQVRPVDLGPRQLLEFLGDTTERFARETGITAKFVSDLDEVLVAPRVGRELARILQEALVNVRKHSGARNTVVRFTSSAGWWRLVIDDDGKGFDFNGRHALAELDAMRKGPVVIKERVRAIGGELTIESTPGQGSRLEISLPQRAYG